MAIKGALDMVAVSTGNDVDVIYDVSTGKQVLMGIKPHGQDRVIPLRHPEMFLSVLAKIVEECEPGV